jgi:putative GTP pyrophosphokinase
MINKNSNKLNKKSFKPNNKNIINYKNPATKSFPQTIASESNEDFYEMTFKFQKIMMIYESAIKMIETKLEVLSKEYKITGQRNPIDSVRSRIKTPVSIANKLEKRNLPISFSSMTENLCDIAGIRVICPYISDIYLAKDILLKQPDIKLISEKDYIKNPKESGYRSLHIVVEVPVYLSNTEHNVKVEIQLRTIAMDFWASLEHELRYKTSCVVPESIKKELLRCAETIAITDRQMEQIAMELQTIN